MTESRSRVRAGGSRRRRSPGNRPTDDALLDAACSVFHAAGFRAASMEAIAEAADSTKPTLYAHFGSKDGVYRACLQREADKLRTALFASYDSASSLDVAGEVRADMLAFFEYATRHPQGFGLLFDDSTSGPNTEIRDDLTDQMTARIAERIRDHTRGRAAPAGGCSAELLAAMLVGIAVHGARQALTLGADTIAVGELAGSLANAGLRHLDVRHIAAVDGASTV